MSKSIVASAVRPTMIPMKQIFSLPSTIIYFITMNPSSPKVYNKLIQCCKYFFKRNQILVARNITDKTICSNDKCHGFRRCCLKIDINKITSKIWITHCLYLYQNNIPDFTAWLCPKIYRCDILILKIVGGTINFDDFKCLAFSAKKIRHVETRIVSNNGDPVMLENIFEALPNIEYYDYFFVENSTVVNNSTLKNISKLKNLGYLKNLKNLDFWNIPELDDIFTCIKEQKDIIFWLHFADNITEEFKNQLDQLTDSLIEAQISNCYITYFDQNEEKNDILSGIFNM